MAAGIPKIARVGAPPPAVMLSAGLLFLATTPFVAHDLVRSVREEQALRADAHCGQAPPPCLEATTLTVTGYEESRRTALETWWTVDAGGNRDGVYTLPSSAELQEGPTPAYTVDGKVVAVMAGDQRVPAALAGSHAVALDSAFLLMGIGMGRMGARNALAARRSGVGWTDKSVSPNPFRRRTPEPLVLKVGTVGMLTAFMLALDARASVVATAAILAAGFLAKRLWGPLWRRTSTGGRHAAY